jgi:transporter family-2 protein
MAYVLMIVAVLGGLSFVFQQAVNSNLRMEIGYPFWAGTISYAGGTIAMLLLVIAAREPFLSGADISKTYSLSWTGGVFGAIYIAISILLLPRIGAATLIACIVLGQMLGSLIFDHYGLLGVPIHQVTSMRLLGAALLLGGVVLIKA